MARRRLRGTRCTRSTGSTTGWGVVSANARLTRRSTAITPPPALAFQAAFDPAQRVAGFYIPMRDAQNRKSHRERFRVLGDVGQIPCHRDVPATQPMFDRAFVPP